MSARKAIARKRRNTSGPGKRATLNRYARQKGVKIENTGNRRKNATLAQVEARKAKSVDFLRRVAGNEQADKLAAEPARSYARRKGIRLENPSRRRNLDWFPLGIEELRELHAELLDYSFFQASYPAATPADWLVAKEAVAGALAAAEAGGTVRAATTGDGLTFDVSAPNPRRRARRRNCDDDGLAAAGAAFESFQGREPTGVVDVDRDVTAPPVLSKLGDLVSLTVLTLDGGKKRISFSREDAVVAAQNPSGDQIYFAGGNQDVRALLDDLGVDASKDMVELGQCVEIEYFTRKSIDQFQPVRYYHEFGEETGVIPTLAFDQLNLHLELVGGAYYIRPEGIRN